jgi:hypothetical protein
LISTIDSFISSKIFSDDLDPETLFHIALCHFYGFGIEPNYSEAVGLLEITTSKNYIESGIVLAQCIEKEFYGIRNLNKSFELYKAAAENKHVEAIVFVGDCYFEGRGVCQNYLKAMKKYTKAKNKGNITAITKLATCYENSF